MKTGTHKRSGFTLIELSIVLVIIGLIVGGVLVGRDLINAATVRAQITQIEKYNQAVNTFYGKYGFLPGDLTSAAATQFGFATRAGTGGRGDGNGELDGTNGGGTVVYAWSQIGEELLFWVDLSTARLIDGSFSTFQDGANPACTTNCNLYLPSAKMGNGNMVYVYSGYAMNCCAANYGIGPNFFGVSVINTITSGGNVGQGSPPSAPGMTVAQAYAIDNKVDDGFPTSGRVMAQYLSPYSPLTGSPGWAASGAAGATPTAAAAPSSTTCYDDNNNGANTMAYTLTQNNGLGVNCALSFRMQAGSQ